MGAGKKAMRNNCQNDHSGFSACAFSLATQLAAEGWERRFIADAKRAQDAIEMYQELGQEVRVETIVLAEIKEECQGCWLVLSQLKAVYTRKKAKPVEKAS